MSPGHLVRPLVRALHAYTPGEQPKIKGLIKLNTNENPYPPSTAVLKAVRAATDNRLRLYPNPAADRLREKLARFHHCSPDHIIVGNGSDELLALAIRTFVEPRPSQPASSSPARRRRSLVQYFHPSYSLYPVLADTHGAECYPVRLAKDFGFPVRQRPSSRAASSGNAWEPRAALTLITTPNAPSGRGYSTDDLDAVCAGLRGVVVLDEAYVDFAVENAMALALKHPHVLVARTFSKAYALCFLRVGYMVGHPELIAALHKMRDSYSVNGLGQVAAEATLDDLPYYRRNFGRVIATRERLSAELSALGFRVLPSQTNFVLVEPPKLPAETWHTLLRKQRILVRWFSAPDVCRFLRISIGTDAEIDTLLEQAGRILGRRTGTRTRTPSRTSSRRVNHG